MGWKRNIKLKKYFIAKKQSKTQDKQRKAIAYFELLIGLIPPTRVLSRNSASQSKPAATFWPWLSRAGVW